MTPVKRPATGLILGVFLLACIALHFNFTPAAVNDRPADTAFSVRNAVFHLTRIAAAPHSLGTAANDTVRSYLYAACQAMGLEVKALPFTCVNPMSKGLIVGKGTNIMATLKGSGGEEKVNASGDRKKILVMGHFDSQPNAFGAGDDGSACAAMLETMRALKAGPPLTRDVAFLFTNGEEDGMLGAFAFAKDSANLNPIGLVLNFDGRGDAGNCIMFRTSPHSHWLIDGYAHAPVHHVTGSFYNELFNLLPNNTDLTPLLRAHMPGFDFAYVDGFTAYHNLTDNVANIDRRTIQEEGDNMLGMVRYFDHADLEADAAAGAERTQANDTFFDILGPLMVHYSPTLNFMLVLGANLLVLLSLGYGLVVGRIRLVTLLLGLLLFIATLAVLYFVTRWTLLGLRTMYPLYQGYYPNSYGGRFFYAALAAESALLFTLFYRWPLRRWSLPSLFMAVLILQLILLDVLYRYIPAGVYWLYWPLIGAAVVFPFLPAEKSRKVPRPRYWPAAIALIPVILFLPQMVYSLAFAFDLQGEAAINGVIMGLLLGLTLPLMKMALRESGWFLPAFAFCLFAIAAIAGIAGGGYNDQRPFKSDLHYMADQEVRSARWISNARATDRWNTRYLTRIYQGPDPYTYPLERFKGRDPVLTSAAPYIDLPAAKLTVTRDTIQNGQRLLYLHCKPPPGTTSLHFSFNPANPATAITVDGKTQNGPLGWMDVINPTPEPDGFDLIIACPAGKEFNVHLTARTLGLPAAAGFQGYPPDVIPFPGPYANTTMVMDQYVF